MIRILFFIWLSACVEVSFADALYSFKNPGDAKRFTALTRNIRCVTCQNQSLADSEVPLARDLKSKIYQFIVANKTDQEIEAFLSTRYGEYIFFKPRFNGHTALLWLFPLLALCVGCAILYRINQLRKFS